MTATERLDQWAALADGATPAPWVIEHGRIWTEPPDPIRGEEIVSMSGSRAWMSDAEFIAASREAVPALIAAVKAVLDQCDRWDAAGKDEGWGGLIREAITSALDGAR